ncbi:hypothetical protein DMB42_46705 [Nonomuraea sp. WAC 01424]|uniref:hypothetical protein n=1 Tax=Nonomuraea sp. WAC 01424 TaxID=2203200 RepID=UPI000F7769F7|nr:hypothetical protein [Nonomuraea sp. WAC 01424]RSM97063.1 hypothetical protein DMB42_46705 [Nonomuraea sp. WAC 01424]
MGRTWPAAVTLLAAVVLTGGCGDGPEGPGAGEPGPGAPRQARPVITPQGRLVPEEDTGDLPEATAQVGLDCQNMLNDHDFAGAAGKMDAVVADPGSSDSEKAVARVCGAAAKANSGQWRQALARVDSAKKHQAALPRQMRPQLMGLLDQTELVSAVALGENERAREVIGRLEKLGPLPAGYLRNACAVASDPGSLPECATVTASSGPAGPGPSGPAPGPGEPGTGSPGGPVDTGGATEPPGGSGTPGEGPSEPPGDGNSGPPGEGPSGPPDGTGPAPGPS